MCRLRDAGVLLGRSIATTVCQIVQKEQLVAQTAIGYLHFDSRSADLDEDRSISVQVGAAEQHGLTTTCLSGGIAQASWRIVPSSALSWSWA